MGLDIRTISPEEIAISVTAEMVAFRRNAESKLARALAIRLRRDGALRTFEVNPAAVVAADRGIAS